MKFKEFDLDDRIQKGIDDAGFETCTQVQAESYPITLAGKDVLVQSQTGSGKTAAFLIPVFSKLLKEGGKALIIAPTRELAIQILDEAKMLGKELPLKTACFYGGTGYKGQEEALKNGVDIAIGTPGRLLDFGKSGKLKFNEFTMIVIDEADRLFDMGFYPDIRTMMKKACKPEHRQTMLFSATLSLRVRQLAWEYMNVPEEVEIEPDTIAVEEIDQSVYHVSSSEKMNLLLGILKKEEPETVLIFTNTKVQASILSQRLNYNGFKSMFISGDLPQNKRIAAINKIKSGELTVLTATDVAARGIHIDDLPLVINYDIPEDYEVYVHRIGRTARAGKSGKAVTLACEKYVFHLEAIEDYIGRKIPVEWVEEELLAEDQSVGKPIERPFDRDRDRNRRDGDRRGGRGNRSSDSRRPGKEGQRTGGKGRPENRNKRRGIEGSDSGKRPRPTAPKPTKDSTREERLEYYRQKYGEDFDPAKVGGQNRGGQNRGGQSRGGQSRGGQSRGGQSRGGQNRGGQNRGGQNRGGQNRGGQNRGSQNRGGQNRGGQNRKPQTVAAPATVKKSGLKGLLGRIFKKK